MTSCPVNTVGTKGEKEVNKIVMFIIMIIFTLMAILAVIKAQVCWTEQEVKTNKTWNWTKQDCVKGGSNVRDCKVVCENITCNQTIIEQTIVQGSGGVSRNWVENKIEEYFIPLMDKLVDCLIRLLDIERRLFALEKTVKLISSEDYCQGKIDMMIEYNLSSVDCGGISYHNTDFGLIGIQGVESEALI